jgi:tetratricopeptide (TPR) repeat protein
MTLPRRLFPALLLAAAIATSPASNPPANPQGSYSQAGAQNANQEPPPPQASHTNPKAKRPPSAKTKQEYDQYLAAAEAPDAAASEKLAREFEVQFPNSELLPGIYQVVMAKYQKADNGDKALDMGRKVLQYDPDSCVALVMNATVLAERTRATDLDREPRLKEATSDAERALENVRTGNFMLTPNATPEQVQQFKDQVSGMAYTALGTAELMRNNNAVAEQNLHKAAESPVGKGDAIVWYRLALALDHQNKYPEANTAITTALALAPAGSAVANMARNEQSRLKQLSAGGSAASPSKSSNQPEPEVIPPK